MPPGIDGKETATRIRALDPDINLVIVTGYSDFSPIEISKAAGPLDKIFYIAKPFEVAEVVQTATALSSRWAVDHELTAARAQLAEQVVQLEEQGLELAANESRAFHLATHDSLTEAPNRLAFTRALADHCEGGHCFATAMLDLDRFKMVNDTLGHLAGDELIRHGLRRSAPPACPQGGFVARLGGDEFGILFRDAGRAGRRHGLRAHPAGDRPALRRARPFGSGRRRRSAWSSPRPIRCAIRSTSCAVPTWR